MAMPVAPVQPPPLSPDLVFASNPELTISPRKLPPQRRRRWRTFFVVLFSLGGTVGALDGIYLLVAMIAGTPTVNIHGQLEEFNCDLASPEGWKHDRGLQEKMRVLYGLKRKLSSGQTQAALEIEDFKERFPSKSVLLDTFKDRVGGLFDNDFAWQPKAPATVDRLDKLATLGGQPAYALEFEGQRDSERFTGECFIMEYRGYVYWFFTFARETGDTEEKEDLAHAWDELRQGFSVLDKREDWKPPTRRTRTHAGKGYELQFATDVWRSADDRSDPRSALTLVGLDPKGNRESEDSKAGRAATLQVVFLGKADDRDPGKLLRDHYLARQVEAEIGKLDELQLNLLKGRDDKPLVSNHDFGKARGTVSKHELIVQGGNTADRFVVLVTVPRGETTLGIYIDSRLKLRDYWEQEIAAVLDGFKVTGP